MSRLTAVQSDQQLVGQPTSSFHKLRSVLESSFRESCEALRERWYEELSRQMFNSITEEFGLVVQNGPFQGMRYLPDLGTPRKIIQYVLLPKLIGCYEAELHGVLAEVMRRNYDRIVNIGCSEGYYSVGFSLRLPPARIFAFDVDPVARQFCQRMACLNGVQDRVLVAGECTRERLQKVAGSFTLVVCDCEGSELALLQPELVPSLNNCDLIIELHDCVDPTIPEVVLSRFAHSHDVTILNRIDRDPSAYPSLKRFTAYRQQLAVQEYRWGTPGLWAFVATRYRQA